MTKFCTWMKGSIRPLLILVYHLLLRPLLDDFSLPFFHLLLYLCLAFPLILLQVFLRIFLPIACHLVLRAIDQAFSSILDLIYRALDSLEWSNTVHDALLGRYGRWLHFLDLPNGLLECAASGGNFESLAELGG